MILDHLATHFGVNWPYDSEEAITAEITRSPPLYHGMTWDALGDQGRAVGCGRRRPDATCYQSRTAALPAPATA